MARHLSEKYPSRSRAAKPADKLQHKKRAPPSARPGPAKLDRQLSRDGDMGYQAVIEELPMPAGYTGPTMTTSMSMQARTVPRTRTRPLTVRRTHPSSHAAHATLHRRPTSPAATRAEPLAGRDRAARAHQGARGQGRTRRCRAEAGDDAD